MPDHAGVLSAMAAEFGASADALAPGIEAAERAVHAPYLTDRQVAARANHVETLTARRAQHSERAEACLAGARALAAIRTAD